MSEVNEMKSLTLNGTKYDSFLDQTARAAAASKLPGPASAKVGQYLVVEEVDADGKTTKVKTVEAPSGGPDSGQKVELDTTLTVEGKAADAKAVGDALAKMYVPERLPNPHPLTINGKAYDGSEAVDVVVVGGSASGSSLLGQTPITLPQDASVKLVGEGEHAYSVIGKTVADFFSAAIVKNYVTLKEEEDYLELTVNGSPSAWHSAYAALTYDGLTVGESYTFCIESLGIDSTNKVFNGYFLIKSGAGAELARMEDKPAGLASVAFTATTEKVVVQWYPANNYYWNAGYRTARVGDLYINKTSDGTDRTGVFNESGTFTGSYSLGLLSKGVTITSEPSCEVYSMTGESGSGNSASLKGKVVVCMGDSLFGMYTGDASAPAFVALSTGATVHNVGFSGCRMSEHPYATHNPFSMYALADAIATGDWSLQDEAVAGVSSNFPEQLAILKDIDFSAVDYVVIHYGTNDFAAGEGRAMDNQNTPKATNTLCGALRYSVEKLLSAFPKLKVFVSLPAFRYWTDDNGVITYSDEKTNVLGLTLPEYVAALVETAKEYNLPVIDSYYGLGINKSNASAFLADGTHHNMDGRKRFGEYIGAKLISGGDSFHASGGGSVGEGNGESGACSLLVVTFTTDANGVNTPSHTYAQVKEWIDNGGSAVLTNGQNWYTLGFMNASQIWFERSVMASSGTQYVRYVLTVLGKLDRVVSEYINDEPADVEPAEDDIPKVFFGGALQQTKTEAVVPFLYISKTRRISGYAEIKAQGNSSMNYAKKNQTVKLFKDADCTEKLKVDFKGWGSQNKHVYKANWIDLSHARNVVSARLWADVVKSRADYAELPELLRTSPNQGAVDGFPVKVYAAGVYQGRYTLNIPKDKWTFNMDDGLDEHCVLCGENYVSGCFRASANIDGSDWTDEIHDTVPASIKTRWNEVISFVMNSTDAEFRANLENYFYVDSLIDYHLFGLQSCGLDAYGKNQIYMTYGGQKWIADMYDMDSTWGLYWNGSKFVASDYPRTSYEDYVSASATGEGNLLYIRLEQCFREELQNRWAELKNGALSIENIIDRFERFTDIAPADLVKEDYASTTGGGEFTGIPSQTTNNIQQIRAFALARQAWTNEYISALPESTTTYLRENYNPNGESFLDETAIDFSAGDYIEAEIDASALSNTTLNTIISIGDSIHRWLQYNLHFCYQASTKELQVNFVYGPAANTPTRTIIALDSDTFTVKFDGNGVHVNGRLLDVSEYYRTGQQFPDMTAEDLYHACTTAMWAKTSLQVGCMEGTVRLPATYNYIKVVRY